MIVARLLTSLVPIDEIFRHYLLQVAVLSDGIFRRLLFSLVLFFFSRGHSSSTEQLTEYSRIFRRYLQQAAVPNDGIFRWLLCAILGGQGTLV